MPIELPQWHRQAFLDPIVPALGIGAATGVCGLTVGSVTGLFTSAHPKLFASVAGLQWFLLGSSYYYCRGVLVSSNPSYPSRNEELGISGIAGCLSGAANGALRGRANIIPGAIVVGLFGLVGQAGFNVVKDRSAERSYKDFSSDKSIGSSRWLLFRSLSDSDYESLLQERLLKVNTEISILDDQIAALRSAGNIELKLPR